jgi:uncharacterized membrane protein YjgN (DUF898 family)
MFTDNSSVTRPAPISPLGSVRASAAMPLPEPQAAIDDNAVEFSGTGSEYFRIWIVNLLLIIVTFGIYLPWAKVRRLKYFYNNTHVDGHALDFHGNGKQMLRGTAIAGVFLVCYSIAADFSPIAAWIAGLAFIAIWPAIYRASIKFRLANTSWRGLRFRLHNAPMKEAYLAVGIPNALIIIPFLLLGTAGADEATKNAAFRSSMGTVFFICLGLFFLTLPYFLWRMKRYQINHAAWGPLRMQFRSSPWAMYKLFFKALLLVALLIGLASAMMFLMVPGLFVGGKPSFGKLLAFLPLIFGFIILLNILPKAYLVSAIQNLSWSRTGNSWVRFKSELNTARYMLLQVKNYFLIAITLGLYWPFAAIANQRMRVQAITLKSRIALDKLTDAARAREKDAAGDMAADMFDMDFGM